MHRRKLMVRAIWYAFNPDVCSNNWISTETTSSFTLVLVLVLSLCNRKAASHSSQYLHTNNSILMMLTIPFIGKTHYYYCWVKCVKNCSLFRKRGLPVPVM
jgi:hypothetical protein